MASRILLAFLFLLSAANVVFCALTKDYQDLSAQAKQDALWAEISQDPFPLDNLPVDNPGQSLFTVLTTIANPFFLARAFTHVSDEMIENRPKIIHARGTTAKVIFRINANSQYTGIFKKNQEHIGVCRASLVFISNVKFSPSLAIKVLRDGAPSDNILTLFNRDTQGSNLDWFANNQFTTIVPATDPALEQTEAQLQHGIFAIPGGPLNWPEDENNIPVFDHARENVPFLHPVIAPFSLTFIPALHQDANDTRDFRAKLAEIPAGTKLYDVAARRTKYSADEIIGELVLQSEFVASPYQDETLFFQHPHLRWRLF